MVSHFKIYGLVTLAVFVIETVPVDVSVSHELRSNRSLDAQSQTGGKTVNGAGAGLVVV